MLRPGNDKGLANPIPLGLAALGSTTFVGGVAIIFQPHASLPPYLMQALLFGGLIELLAGMWAFVYGDTFSSHHIFISGCLLWMVGIGLHELR